MGNEMDIEQKVALLSQHMGKASFPHGADRHAAFDLLNDIRSEISSSPAPVVIHMGGYDFVDAYPAPSGEVEAVEVVAHVVVDGGRWSIQPIAPERLGPGTPLMTVAQHQRIVAAKDAEIANRLTAAEVRALVDAKHAEVVRLAEERDELRAQLAAQQAAVPVDSLGELRRVVESFYTATCTNAKGRDNNRERKQHALSLIDTLLAAPAAPQQANVETHHDVAHRAMWHTNCPNNRFGGPMKPTATGWECVSCAARLNADRSAQGGE